MREILFRGKDIETGKWIFGYYFFECQRLLHCIAGFNTENIVDSKTVGQYTGLHDKKGNKIFENDIVKDTDTNKLYTVEYQGNGFVRVDENRFFFYFFDEDILEVVGNIFDNPELLQDEVN